MLLSDDSPSVGEGNGTKVEKAELEAEIVEQREGSEKVAEEPMPEIVEERESEVEEAQGARSSGNPEMSSFPMKRRREVRLRVHLWERREQSLLGTWG